VLDFAVEIKACDNLVVYVAEYLYTQPVGTQNVTYSWGQLLGLGDELYERGGGVVTRHADEFVA
jgi:hypothetical protein